MGSNQYYLAVLCFKKKKNEKKDRNQLKMAFIVTYCFGNKSVISWKYRQFICCIVVSLCTAYKHFDDLFGAFDTFLFFLNHIVTEKLAICIVVHVQADFEYICGLRVLYAW